MGKSGKVEKSSVLTKPSYKGQLGGARVGGGRKAGGMNAKTKELKFFEEELRQRVLKTMHPLLDAQFNLAKGCTYLYVIRTEVGPKGGRVKLPPELVTNAAEIEEFLAGSFEGSQDEYYYLTTEKPDNKAIDSLLDRTFGRAVQAVKGPGPGGVFEIVELDPKKYARILQREIRDLEEGSEKEAD